MYRQVGVGAGVRKWSIIVKSLLVYTWYTVIVSLLSAPSHSFSCDFNLNTLFVCTFI